MYLSDLSVPNHSVRIGLFCSPGDPHMGEPSSLTQARLDSQASVPLIDGLLGSLAMSGAC